MNVTQINFINLRKSIAKFMDLNKFSFYRANPFANNNFIPAASMNNRKRK
jgi:hypothetical protein